MSIPTNQCMQNKHTLKTTTMKHLITVYHQDQAFQLQSDWCENSIVMEFDNPDY